MADLTDAAEGLVLAIAAIIYPRGTAAPSVADCPIIVYQGWPEPQTLQADLAAGKAHISIFPRPGGKVSSITLGDTDWEEASNDGAGGVGVLEIERRTETLQVSIWASTPAQRDTIARALVPALAMLTRIAMPDGSTAMLSSGGAVQIDAQQTSGIYRRDLLYSINYAITYRQDLTAITTIAGSLSSGPTADSSGPTLPLS